MKKTLFIAILVMALAAVSCGNNSNNKKEGTTSTTPAKEQSKSLITQTYTGIIPAADGPGIRYDATFIHYDGEQHGTYHLRSTYMDAADNKDQSIDSYGRFEIEAVRGERVMALHPSEVKDGVIYYVMDDESSITMLDRDMKRIVSNLNYTLKKIK